MKANVIANYCGQAWRLVVQLAFVPLYIKFLGIEAYGLIGIYALLSSWLTLVDMGMRPTLLREMARFTAGAHDAQSIRDLLRSIECIVFVLAGCVGVGVWAASGGLASDWLNVGKLPAPAVAHAVSIMGVVIGLRLVESIYVSAFVGLQRQVLQNILTAAADTARVVGAITVLVFVSPTIEAFFIWQGLVSLATVGVLAGVLYQILPKGTRPARFSRIAILEVWNFAAGMAATTLLALLLSQIDKIILSRLISLEVFGYYVLATVVANALNNLEMPIVVSFYPRFTELAAHRDDAALSSAYHQSAQLVTVVVGAAAAILIVFCRPVLMAWTADAALVDHVAPLVTVLVMGTLLHSLMGIPGALALAFGWASFTVYVNLVAVCFIVPLIFWLVPTYGAIGAAWAWVALNSGYVVFAIALLHRRLLVTEKWSWYAKDVMMPLGAALITAYLCRKLAPDHVGRLGEFAILFISSGLVLIAAALSATRIRNELFRQASALLAALNWTPSSLRRVR